MPPATTKFKTVDEYISSFPEDIRETLKKIRQTIQQAAPDAEELIHYQMPAFRYNGNVIIYFSAHKKHYGITIPHPGKVFAAFKEFADFDISKSTIRFPLDKPFPFELMGRVVGFVIESLGH